MGGERRGQVEGARGGGTRVEGGRAGGVALSKLRLCYTSYQSGSTRAQRDCAILFFGRYLVAFQFLTTSWHYPVEEHFAVRLYILL